MFSKKPGALHKLSISNATTAMIAIDLLTVI